MLPLYATAATSSPRCRGIRAQIVTGAGSTAGQGMATGRATAIVFAREGAHVAVAGEVGGIRGVTAL